MTHQQRSEETRSRILLAALNCFSRTGYDATSVAELCDAAGVSKGAFYHHFPSKHAVFIELLNEWLGGLDAQFSAIRAEAVCVPDALRAMARTARQIFADAHGQLPMYLEFLAQASRDPELWQVTIEPFYRYQSIFAELVRAGIAEGSLRPVDPDTAARAIIGVAIGLLAQGITGPEDGEAARSVESGMEMLLEGLQV